MNREELQKTSNELIQAARSNDAVRIAELIGDVFECGRVAGIEEALAATSATYESLKSQQAQENDKDLIMVFRQRSAGASEVNSKIRALLEAKT